MVNSSDVRPIINPDYNPTSPSFNPTSPRYKYVIAPEN
jgi:hypothetical protein